MLTSWLVPLGQDFELSMGISCDGYSSRTFEELIGKIDGKESEKNILYLAYFIDGSINYFRFKSEVQV